jgi:hypothetical protein
MPEIELEQKSEQIIIRLRLSAEEAVQIRNDLKKDYANIPKLNKETFESFGQWVFEDLDDSLVQSLTDFFVFDNEKTNKASDPKEDNDPSEFEPW